VSLAERVRAARTVEQKLDLIAEELDRALVAQIAQACKPEKPAADRPSIKHGPDVLAVWKHWQQTFGRTRAKLTLDRRRKIESRLREGYSVERIKRAIDGCHGSDFHTGRGEYHGGTQYVDITLICRTGSKLEEFEAMPPRRGGTSDKFLG
jgi:hypothetical protein